MELTVRDRGPVVRAEASAQDRYAALDAATAKLVERLRRARDRRKDHQRGPQPIPAGVSAPAGAIGGEAAPGASPAIPTEPGVPVEATLGDSPVVIRQKVHRTVPMTVDDALYEMELVGHPFYLFIDADSAQPCVVYRRHGWTYGVIRVDASVATAPSA